LLVIQGPWCFLLHFLRRAEWGKPATNNEQHECGFQHDVFLAVGV
jgi:hypothetical protein